MIILKFYSDKHENKTSAYRIEFIQMHGIKRMYITEQKDKENDLLLIFLKIQFIEKIPDITIGINETQKNDIISALSSFDNDDSITLIIENEKLKNIFWA